MVSSVRGPLLPTPDMPTDALLAPVVSRFGV